MGIENPARATSEEVREFARNCPTPNKEFAVPFNQVSQSSEQNRPESEDEESNIDLGRGDKRKLYLKSLKSLVPSLKHGPEPSAAPSGHFSLLQAKPSEWVMPFLPEIYQEMAKKAKVTNIDTSIYKDIHKRVSSYYITTEPTESTLFKGPNYSQRTYEVRS